MSVETRSSASLEDKVHNTLTWWRVPLMVIAFLGLLGFITKKDPFWLGVPVALIGEMIQIWAASHLHKDEHLAISGPYSHVRNPMYLGRFVLGLGFFIMTGNPYMVVGYVVLFAAYAHIRVGREERRLKQIFVPDYQNYCNETRRWLPKLKPYSGSEPRRASWTQVCRNHEQINLIGVVIVFALVYLRIDKFPNIHW